MVRTIIGGLLGGIALYVVGFIFWGTPLSGLAFAHADEAHSAAVQQALAANLTPSGTGSYVVPDPTTSGGTTLYGQGPIAMVHFNLHGFPLMDGGALIEGLILALVAGVLVALALQGIAARSNRMPEVLRAGILMALGVTGYLDLGQPVFNHYDWGYFVYGFLGDLIGFSACAAVIAWFLTRGRSAQ